MRRKNSGGGTRVQQREVTSVDRRISGDAVCLVACNRFLALRLSECVFKKRTLNAVVTSMVAKCRNRKRALPALQTSRFGLFHQGGRCALRPG